MNNFLLKAFKFCTGLLIIYLLIVFTVANSSGARRQMNSKTLRTNLISVQPGESSLQRFREIDDCRDVDILFIGSSHCYRSFDVRFFDHKGVSSFNMGSTSQSPLNSYYLLRRWVDNLNPKLAVIEVYWEVLAENGLESSLDLLSNVELSPELAQMAFSVGDIRAVNNLLMKLLRLEGKVEELPANIDCRDRYIKGGFVERIARESRFEFGSAQKIDINHKQLDYLRKSIEYLQDRKVQVLLVSQPVPQEMGNTVTNYDEVSKLLQNVAKICDISYIDYNEKMDLNTEEYYYDRHHLNQEGVQLFNEVFWLDLHKYSDYFK